MQLRRKGMRKQKEMKRGIHRIRLSNFRIMVTIADHYWIYHAYSSGHIVQFPLY
uniref:Uncharacterized protein n=1 Tax=Nelumbo nucifera TaxID=4432 RepID=A0A822Z874_NELNU|nr:TPA_asm: hypothetical protein HUJ06_013559 [Nelumbo nucifera]